MKHFLLPAAVLALAGLASGAEAKSHERLKDAADVVTAMMQAGDKSIPEDMLQKSECVIVIPGMKKGGFIVAAKYGKGFMSCRAASGWSAPAPMRAEGGGVGFQIGGEESDLLLLIFNRKGAEKLMADKFTVGADGAVAAGPVGRSSTAQTDAAMHAEMLSWSRSRGVFAGISLDGATLRQDPDWTAELYGKKDIPSKQIIYGNTKAPAGSEVFLSTLKKYSPAKKK
jgi:SH3 domain-containing YSC84-like protein 1